MKRIILFMVALLSISQTAFAYYDFSAVAPSGQTLYYSISGSNVTVVYPNNNWTWQGYTKPVGDLIIPDTVTYNGTTYTVTRINHHAFSGCTDLTSVTISDSIIIIEYQAFLQCSGLTSLIIGKSVASIGNAAFGQCTGLTSVVFNADSCTSIGASSTLAFQGCTNINSFTFGSNVKVIPQYLCYQMTHLTSVTIGDSVTSIGNYAFYRCTRLTSITIPNSVTYIGDHAFYGCTGLTSIIIPNSVTSIGAATFFQCSGLTTVTIGNSVASIANNAFNQCTGLTSVVFNADSCTSVGTSSASAFQGCTNINSFTFGSNVEVIPNHLCCGMTGLTSLVIPSSVRNIGTSAFSGCTGLTSVVFNADSCTWAGASSALAFQGCTNINSFTFGSNVKVIPQYLCYQMAGLLSVIIPDSVSIIGSHAFYGCTGLTSVTIPNSVRNIGSSAFKNCINLTSVVFNADSCTSEGTSSSELAFQGCTNINSFTFGSNVEVIPNHLCCGMTGLTSVTIPNSVTYIGDQAFYGCTGLTSITIPNSVTSIGGGAFAYCSGLTSVILGNSVDRIGSSAFSNCTSLASVTIGNYVTYIGSYAFSQCTGLTSVAIPNSVTYIGDHAFYGCTGLTSIIIPNSVTSIGAATFFQCSGLTSVTIGNSVTSIGNKAFYQCGGLTSLTIGNSVTSIGTQSFYQCGGLSSVIFPSTVTSIGYEAFYMCGLSSITFLSPTPPSIYDGFPSAFVGIVSNCAIYIPCGSWSQYAAIINHLLNQIDYVFSAVSADDSTGTVQILTEPSCTSPDAVISAIPANGYRFDHWNTGSTDNPYTLTVTSDTTITAFFVEYIPETYTVTVLSDNTATGSVTGGGVYEEGTLVTITAYPADGYHFDHWSTGRTNNPDTLIVTSDTTITAFFEEDLPATYIVTVLVDNPTTGSVTGGGEYEDGTSATITAYPADGYHFDHWSTGSTDNPYTLTVTSDTTITAFFEEDAPVTYTVTVLVDNPAAGSVNGGGVYEDGSSATITAYPANGYHFDHWSTGSTDNPYTLTVTSDTTITAYFVSNGGGTDGIGEVGTDDIRISVSDGHIFVEGITDEEVLVYDITGRWVQNHSLPSGVYIVKIGTLPARKVVVMR